MAPIVTVHDSAIAVASAHSGLWSTWRRPAASPADPTISVHRAFATSRQRLLHNGVRCDHHQKGTGVKQSRAHYRTRDYWPGTTTVTVTASLYGADLGHSWGQEDITRTFTIGRSQIVKADVNSFRLVVLVDGAVAKNYPVSYGRNTDDPELETRSGTHVVQEKFDSFTMCNPKYGYCGFIANWAVRISNNGEFIHENAAVIDSLGKENVSHGCVNMSPADAKDFYDNALYGDPVEVTGTSTQLSPADGDIFDWTYSFDQWKSFSAL